MLSVESVGAAATAGIQKGDYIQSFHGEKVRKVTGCLLCICAWQTRHMLASMRRLCALISVWIVLQVRSHAAMSAVVQTVQVGDEVAIEIDRNGDGIVDAWATHHLRVGAVGYTPEQVAELRRQGAQAVSVQAKVKEAGTGLYSVTYMLDQPGQYRMDVLVKGEPIADSPFDLRTGVGDAFGPKCRASGDGLRRAREMEEATFFRDNMLQKGS